MVNFSRYTLNDLAATFLQIDDQKAAPSLLSQTERDRLTHYIVRSAYYAPGRKGLYQQPLSDMQTLADLRQWKSTGTNRYYPDDMWGAFNPIPRLVDTDTSALMNEFEPEGIIVYNEDGVTPDERLSQAVQQVLIENDFFLFFQKLFTLTASQGDAYVCVRESDQHAGGISLVTYPGQVIFPVLSLDDRNSEIAFRLYYHTSLVDYVPLELATLTERSQVSYYQVITSTGQKTWIDGQVQDEFTAEWDYGGVIPIVHFPFILYDDYFGMTSFDCIMEDIDRVNYMYASLWQSFRRMAEPQILAYGCDVENFMLGKTKFHSLPKDGRIELLNFNVDSQWLTAINAVLDEIKSKVPHFSIFRQISSMSAQSAESFNVRYGVFLSYEKRLERVQANNISKLANVILRVKGLTDRFRRVDVELGPPISQGITEQLAEVQKEIDVLGTSQPVMERVLAKIQYGPDEQDEVIAGIKGKAAAQQQPQTNSVLDRLRARQQARQQTTGEQQ